jgi:hypothetical protein
VRRSVLEIISGRRIETAQDRESPFLKGPFVNCNLRSAWVLGKVDISDKDDDMIFSDILCAFQSCDSFMDASHGRVAIVNLMDGGTDGKICRSCPTLYAWRICRQRHQSF